MKLLKTIFFSTLTAYSSVLFTSSHYLGFFVFLTTLFNPHAAFTGLLGVLFSNLLGLYLGINEERIKKGLYGFNGLLVGLSISLYHNIDFNLILILFAAIVLVVFVNLALEYIYSYYLGLPILSIPFVLVSIIIYFSFYDYHAFISRAPYIFEYDSYFPEIPFYIKYYLLSLGGIFFQTSPWAGLGISLILLISSRIAFLLSIIGFTVGVLFHSSLNGDIGDLSSGLVGFNYILSAIAVGGIFLVPTPSTFFLAGLASMVSVLISSFTKVFFIQFNIPVLALPFTSVTLLFIYVTRLLRNKNFIFVDFIPGSPEANLDYYKTRLKRFGVNGLYFRLPFSGKWKITQGYNGKYTHKDYWKESLDFMAVDSEGKLRREKGQSLEDFYSYGLTVFSPSSGKVIKVVNHLEDNKIGEVDSKNNWGNLVLIEHSQYLYSHISHFLKNSICVKEGDYVTTGAKLGLAGNSGRSLEPHIHLHFQSTPELGSPTIPVSFTQYQKDSDKKISIHFNEIPNEGSILSNLQSDFNLKNFFSLPPGEEISISLTKDHSKVNLEKWTIQLDLIGNRYVENEKGDRLYFYSSLDYFSCLDYIGKKNTGLFFFYLAVYRIPFVSIPSNWSDRMSYKHFSSFPIRLLKDLIHPFSDRVGYEWKGELVESDSKIKIEVKVLQNNHDILYKLSIFPEFAVPGIIEIQNQKGEQWILKKSE